MELLPLFPLVLFFFRGHALSSDSIGSAAVRFRVAALSGLRSPNLLVSHLGGLTGKNALTCGAGADVNLQKGDLV